MLLSLVGCTASLESFEEDGGSSIPSGTNPDGGDGSSTQEDDTNIQIDLTGRLECSSLSWCTNFRGGGGFVEMPETRGGPISNGIYLFQSGSFAVDAFIFEDGKYSQIWTYLVNAYGSFDTDGDKLTTTMESSCSHNGTFPSMGTPDVAEYTYSSNGDELYLMRSCSGPNCNESARLYRRISSICDNIEDYECTNGDGDCLCRQFVEQDIPESSDVGISCNI